MVICWKETIVAYIYTCPACEENDHAHCERDRRGIPGDIGGSMCVCPCEGNPNYNNLGEVATKLADDIRDFEKSIKSIHEDAR